jgi:hypothetical protein
MKKQRLLLLIMMIAPWLTLPLLGSRALQRFLPATIFISIFSELLHVVAKKRRWWQFFTSIHPKIRPSLPFTLGPEFFAALWSLKKGYGRFPFFLLINTIVHLLFAYPGMVLLRKLGIVSLWRLSSFQFVLLLFFRGSLLYSFQFVKEKFFSRKPLWR